MAMTEVPRRGSSSKSFKNVSRGPSLETTAGSVSVTEIPSAQSSGATWEAAISSTLVFVDWDDTLFPSTELFDRWGLELRLSDQDKLTAEQKELLKMWRKSLQRFIKAITEFSGHCAIVTNAETMWVEDCLRRFAPEVLLLLKEEGGPSILHAKDVLRSLRSRKRIWQHDEIALPARHLDVYREDDIQHFKYVEMTAAKYQAMRLEFLRVFGRQEGFSRFNLINFGDMEYEHEAVLELGMRLCELQPQEPLIKSFLLPEEPTLVHFVHVFDIFAHHSQTKHFLHPVFSIS